jgi:hypothetical protein
MTNEKWGYSIIKIRRIKYISFFYFVAIKVVKSFLLVNAGKSAIISTSTLKIGMCQLHLHLKRPLIKRDDC